MMATVSHIQAALFAVLHLTRLKIVQIKILVHLDIKNAIILDQDPDHIEEDLIQKTEITDERRDIAQSVDMAKEEDAHIQEINIHVIGILAIILMKDIDLIETKLRIEENLIEDLSAKAIQDRGRNREALIRTEEKKTGEMELIDIEEAALILAAEVGVDPEAEEM